MIKSVLIANRGEIACRIIKTSQRLGIRTVAVYSDVDGTSLAVQMADEAYFLGPPSASESYLNVPKILKIAARAKVEAIHPGYGFLSESEIFATACEQAGFLFIGPSIKALQKMGSKKEAKQIARQLGIPVIPGYEGNQADLLKEADQIGYPLMIKAVMGGGGKGMREVASKKAFQTALEACQREALASFGNKEVLLEKVISSPRHIEVQLFGDTHGNLLHLFERDCSLQRHHQKVIEEAPSNLSLGLKEEIYEAALKIGRAIQYEGAGTVEFLVDDKGHFYFMEMNTRLQVEHPVTEAITGLDLVEWQFRVVSREKLPLSQNEILSHGHALELRLYAEDPSHHFKPTTGSLWMKEVPEEIRFDTGLHPRDEMTPFYDSLMAKAIVAGENRLDALRKASQSLGALTILGLKTNISFLKRLLKNEVVLNNQFNVDFIDRHMSTLAPSPALPEEIYGIASLINVLADSQENGSPWDEKRNWRLEGYAPLSFEWSCDGEIQSISLLFSPKGWIFGKSGPHEAAILENDLLWGNHRIPFWIQKKSQGKKISLSYKGETYTLSPHSSLPTTPSKRERDSYLKAPLTGKVSLVLVKEGDVVKESQPLLVVEAMKMEHMITSPRGGKIKRIFYHPGDIVEEGQEVLDLGDERGGTHDFTKES